MKTLTILLLLFSGFTYAEQQPTVPQKKHRSNFTCPAKKLLPQLDTDYHECHALYGGEESCLRFIETYKKLLPKYDCEYTDDYGGTWNNPAIFMARSPGAFEDYTNLLMRLSLAEEYNFSEVRMPKAVHEARIVFGSKKFRNILDGDFAESYFDQSLKIAKKLRKIQNETKRN